MKAENRLSQDEIARRKAVLEQASSIQEAANKLGISRGGMRSFINSHINRGDPIPITSELIFPSLPHDDIPIHEIIDLQVKRFEKRDIYAKAAKWFPIEVNGNLPIGISFFGDPHVDDNGCNWKLLKQHCDLHKATPGLYGINVGDTTNNWTGRLERLFANQETSQSTARKLAEWFLIDSGISWMCWVMGNHDLWLSGSDILRRMNTRAIPMHDWQARFKLVFGNKRECKIWVSHQFPGHSMWNTLHGPQKAAHTKAEANIYAAGHTHNWASHQEESASREFIYNLIRSRGYKHLDEYAEITGHDSQRFGSSMTVIIDPQAPEDGFVSPAFPNMEQAAEYLTYLRKKRA